MSDDKKRDYKSPLENYPDYVHAIGMISIENASLESMLGELLGALLGIHLHLGHLLFFTPKAAIARLELIENVVLPSIGDKQPVAKKVLAIIKRARAAMGKRHVFIHSLWAESDWPDDESKDFAVARISFPSWDGGEMSLNALTDLIRDYRQLIEEVGPLIDEVQTARGFAWKRPWQFP